MRTSAGCSIAAGWINIWHPTNLTLHGGFDTVHGVSTALKNYPVESPHREITELKRTLAPRKMLGMSPHCLGTGNAAAYVVSLCRAPSPMSHVHYAFFDVAP
ncbi:hypothetical protein CSUB01_10786 [Colletotrichum sublineola]|uniref:Uncharacterized protein n=1 Tax=Colletotrichum sublineola TaxID=1173701 RepID=A0A066XU46_COLSU|nr:hypothetical protein CSUB01_10786 [Colletotrichum sublineola]